MVEVPRTLERKPLGKEFQPVSQNRRTDLAHLGLSDPNQLSGRGPRFLCCSSMGIASGEEGMPMGRAYAQCPLLPRMHTFRWPPLTSALTPKADIPVAATDFRS